MSLEGKRILLGVAGSIAAYKSALLVRLLVKAGAEVQVMMTDAARQFITPLTLATLSKRPVLSQFADEQTGQWTNHVEWGLWADALVIAPASARTLARCAYGLADDLLSATYLSAKCPVFFAPAMDLDMYRHPATLENLRRLESFGNHIIAAQHGELASGLVGEGRLAEPEEIVAALEQGLALRAEGLEPSRENATSQTLSPKHSALRSERSALSIVITAGPTREPIDPVRYVSNHSTGKMGYAIARAFAEAGANVTLISGPVALELPHPSVKRILVETAAQMLDATLQAFETADVAVLSAAVADYTPAQPADQKIKKKDAEFSLPLRKTADIAATLGQRKRPGQRLMGFALETENEVENAQKKLQSKNLDWIVLNSLRDAGAGFGHDTNQITVLSADGTSQPFPLKSKDDVAADLVQIISNRLMAHGSH